MSVEIIHGDCRAILPALPERSVQTCVTSPPYWGLRDYGLGGWQGGDSECAHAVREDAHVESSTLDGGTGTTGHQREGYGSVCPRCGAVREAPIGLEPTPELFVEHIVECFRAVRRVLRDDGTVWLNLGDSYHQGAKGNSGELRPSDKQATNAGSLATRRGELLAPNRSRRHETLKPKDLVGIPWRVAFALQADGWWLRSDIIWAKPNPMPESCRDRPTRAHEYVFLLSKSARYFYDATAIREPAEYGRREHSNGWKPWGHQQDSERTEGAVTGSDSSSGRNKRSVWTIATQPSSIRHFATFPEALVTPCIQAGTSERGCCPECGAPWVRVVEASSEYADFKAVETARRGSGIRSNDLETLGLTRGTSNKSISADYRTVDWRPTCKHAGEPVPCVVLDPFSGSGTVGVVAKRAGRRAILIEASAEYVELAERRIGSQGVLL